MKNKLLITINTLGIALVIGLFFSLKTIATSFLQEVFAATGSETEATSVGIIGGADGPTAVFVSSPHPPHLQWILYLLLIVVSGIFVLNILYLSRTKKIEK